jgi:ankyrin repeat protein
MNESRVIFIEYFIALSIVVIWFTGFKPDKNWKKWAHHFLIIFWAIFFSFVAYEQFDRIPLYNAIKLKDFKKVDFLLTEKPKLIKYRTLLGGSVLHAAVRNDTKDILVLLIKKNVEINVEDWNSATPLHIAAETDNTAIIKILLDNGANIEARAYKPKMTPLQVAVIHGNLSAVRILVQKGADVNAKYSYNQTTLGLAKKYKQIDIVKYLQTKIDRRK